MCVESECVLKQSELDMSEYCAARHESGWFCLLKKGHSIKEHLSIDNSEIWKGSPGLPVRWAASTVEEKCPDCGGESTRSVKTQRFPYLHGKKTIELTAEVVVWACTLCRLEWTNGDAELERGNAVRLFEHENKVNKSPREVGQIRVAQGKGYTGELCGNCGSPNTVRNGKCLLCMDCLMSGECG